MLNLCYHCVFVFIKKLKMKTNKLTFCPVSNTINILMIHDEQSFHLLIFCVNPGMYINPFLKYICYVQAEILYKLQLIQISCTSCNLYKQLVQVATCTGPKSVHVATSTSHKISLMLQEAIPRQLIAFRGFIFLS